MPGEVVLAAQTAATSAVTRWAASAASGPASSIRQMSMIISSPRPGSAPSRRPRIISGSGRAYWADRSAHPVRPPPSDSAVISSSA